MTLRYPIKLEADDDTVLVTCPALPEVTTFGLDEADARRRAVDAIEEALAARIDAGLDIPAGTKGSGVAVPTLTALKVALYCETRKAGMSRAELARRLSWKRESVDRLFRLDHASRVSQIDAAFEALGKSIDVRVREAA